MIDVYIVSGFLGSGKTTFIKKLLEGKVFEKPMLIENEFGEIGIDGGLFDAGLKVKEINSGCICCSLKGDLYEALDEIKKMDVKSLIIEPSGVGKLSEVMSSIMKDDDYKLKSHICLVDVKKALSYHRNFKEFFDDQVIGANAIILSKVDLVTKEKIEEVKDMLVGLNDEVAIEDEPYQEMDVQRLFSLITRDVCDCEGCDGCLEDDEILKECSHHHHEHSDHHHHNHHHHADEIFEAYSLKTTKTFTRSELEAILKDIKDEVVRAKGIVDSDEYCLYFDISGDDIMISRAKASKSGIVTIISEKVDRPKMEKLFL